MSRQPDLPGTHNSNSVQSMNEASADEDKKWQDFLMELFGIVNSLAASMQTALLVFAPSDEKMLVERLKALQAMSSTWQRSMYASKSHEELMGQVESTTEELHETSERLHSVEAQRLAAVREAQFLGARTEQQEAIIMEARNSLKQKEEDLETLQFWLHEQKSTLSVVQPNVQGTLQAASEADERPKNAAVALHEAKADAIKAQRLAERHQQVVAKLTAENLAFLMQLKKAEADIAAASWERAQLRLAVEQQRGPWFDQVRAGVEDRVQRALQQSQELEASLERQEVEHAAQLEAMQKQQYQLEEQLKATRQHAGDLEKHLAYAHDSKECLEGRHAEAEATVRELRQELDNLTAENRVLQESMQSMRHECTKRCVNEQAALGRVDGLEQLICNLHEALSQITAEVTALQRQLDTQKSINRQLMARKEEMEWQLMVAMSKIDHAADQLAPLSYQVSRLHNVVGPNQQHARNNLDARVAGKVCNSVVYPAGAGGRVVGGDGDPRPSSSRASPGISRNASEQPPQGAATGPTAAAGMKTASLPTMHCSTDATCLAPAPTLLVAHDDDAPVVRTGDIHGHGGAGMTGISDCELASPSQTQPQQGAREDSGTLDVVKTQTRRTSLEGLSLGAMSPTRSVGPSSHLSSPSEARSLQPCEAKHQMPGVDAATIDTVSTGQKLYGGEPSAHESAVPGLVADEGCQAGVSGSGALLATHTTAPGVQSQLQRCSSLHDVDDVWLPNIPISSSSDDSDMLFSPGVVAHHERELRQVHTTPQHQPLDQLQQQLQVHLQMQTTAWEVARPGQERHSQDPDACVETQQQALACDAQSVARDQREDDDSICNRNMLQHSGPSRERTRGPAISIRSTPSQPTGARQRAPRATFRLVKAQKPNDQGDTGIRVLSIMKGGSQRDVAPLCCASPVHPAACSRVASAGSERPPERAPDGGAVSTSAVVLERVPADRVEGVVSMIVMMMQPVADGTAGDTDDVPVLTQAGKPIRATQDTLISNTTVALEHSTLLSGFTGPAVPQHVQLCLPPSPAHPSKSLGMHRPPLHPAIILVQDRDRNRAVGGAASLRGLVSVPRETHPEGPRGYTVACSDVQGTRATPATQPAVSDGHRASAVARGLDASTATPDEGAAAAPWGLASRHRVSFKRMFDDISSTSSSTGSITQADGSISVQPQHKPSSMKSVRISDHEADDDVLLLRTPDGLEQRVGATGSQPQRASSAVDADLAGGRSGASMRQARAAVATESPQAFKSRGPVAHPAIVGLYTSTESSFVIGVDAVDGTLPKCFSAVLGATCPSKAPAGVKATASPAAAAVEFPAAA